MRSRRSALLSLACLATGSAAAAQPAPAARDVSVAEARAVVALAAAEARRLGAPGAAIAVVDAGGHLVALERLDGTFPAASAVSTEKARTAAVFQQPTQNFENAINGGRAALLGNMVMLPLQGGVPLERGGRVVGAVGVSGAASAQQDTEIAQVAAATPAAPSVSSAPPPEVTHLPGADVARAFEKGAPLLETAPYKVHASRRSEPGQAEVHVRDTDVIHVLEGRATLVTGGRVVGGREVAADEIRGASIEGGRERRLGPGDVVVVPNGTPHWFRAVEAPVEYFVVKVSEAPR